MQPSRGSRHCEGGLIRCACADSGAQAKAALDAASQAATEAASGLKEAASGALDALNQSTSGALDGLNQATSGALEGATSALKDVADSVGGAGTAVQVRGLCLLCAHVTRCRDANPRLLSCAKHACHDSPSNHAYTHVKACR